MHKFLQSSAAQFQQQWYQRFRTRIVQNMLQKQTPGTCIVDLRRDFTQQIKTHGRF